MRIFADTLWRDPPYEYEYDKMPIDCLAGSSELREQIRMRRLRIELVEIEVVRRLDEAQALVHGAKVLSIEGNFDQALSIVTQIANRHPVTLVNSLNPFRLEGQKTGAFEVVDQLVHSWWRRGR